MRPTRSSCSRCAPTALRVCASGGCPARAQPRRSAQRRGPARTDDSGLDNILPGRDVPWPVSSVCRAQPAPRGVRVRAHGAYVLATTVALRSVQAYGTLPHTCSSAKIGPTTRNAATPPSGPGSPCTDTIRPRPSRPPGRPTRSLPASQTQRPQKPPTHSLTCSRVCTAGAGHCAEGRAGIGTTVAPLCAPGCSCTDAPAQTVSAERAVVFSALKATWHTAPCVLRNTRAPRPADC